MIYPIRDGQNAAERAQRRRTAEQANSGTEGRTERDTARQDARTICTAADRQPGEDQQQRITTNAGSDPTEEPPTDERNEEQNAESTAEQRQHLGSPPACQPAAAGSPARCTETAKGSFYLLSRTRAPDINSIIRSNDM